jgi:hypothetical protein
MYDFEGDGHSLFQGPIPAFAWTLRKTIKETDFRLSWWLLLMLIPKL